jgi:hypothetical protein
MGTKASTPPDTELIALAAGFAYLGEFPPSPHVQTVEKVLPNDRFQGH